MKKFFYVLALSVFFDGVSGPIYQINSIEETFEHVQGITSTIDPYDAVFVWDIDGTIHTPDGEFGGDEWFCHKLEELKSQGHDFKQALERVLPEYHEAQQVVSVKPTEQEVVELIHHLQEQGCMVFALTARGEAIASITQKQLKSLGISFAQSCGFSNQKADGYFCCNGVVHCGTSDKGSVLIRVLKSIADERDGYTPKAIMYLDDAQRHVESVDRAVSTHYPSVSFCGFRYGGVDHRRAAFCPIRAAEERQLLLGK